ncbi:hypothetical protein J0A90_017330 [Salinicola sp. DM10]|nr:hypothetical protein [Salinicola sp. DM10]
MTTNCFRAGKNLSARATEVVVRFKQPPFALLDDGEKTGMEKWRIMNA